MSKNTRQQTNESSERNLQPTPRTTMSTVQVSVEGVSTAIARTWEPGDSGPEGRCQVCESCHARNGLCLVVVGELVQRWDVALYSLANYRRRTGAIPFADEALRELTWADSFVGSTAFVDHFGGGDPRGPAKHSGQG